MSDTDAPSFETIRLGRMAYRTADARQRAIHEAVVARERGPVLLLLEHDPVITVSRRKGVAKHVIADETELDRLGIAVEATDRGGDVTYHGPGQLVAWPIVRLADFSLNIGRFMRRLEAAVIDAVARFGVTGRREPGMTGVWVDDRGGGPPAKLCAMGIRVRRGVTLHGVALNVDPDLSHFDTIVPCGISDRPVTSLKRLLGSDCPAFKTVESTVADALVDHLGRPGPGA